MEMPIVMISGLTFYLIKRETLDENIEPIFKEILSDADLLNKIFKDEDESFLIKVEMSNLDRMNLYPIIPLHLIKGRIGKGCRYYYLDGAELDTIVTRICDYLFEIILPRKKSVQINGAPAKINKPIDPIIDGYSKGKLGQYKESLAINGDKDVAIEWILDLQELYELFNRSFVLPFVVGRKEERLPEVPIKEEITIDSPCSPPDMLPLAQSVPPLVPLSPALPPLTPISSKPTAMEKSPPTKPGYRQRYRIAPLVRKYFSQEELMTNVRKNQMKIFDRKQEFFDEDKLESCVEEVQKFNKVNRRKANMLVLRYISNLKHDCGL